MDALEIALVTSAGCGVAMVAGTLVLLSRGVITLQPKTGRGRAANGGSFSAKVGSWFSFATDNPVLGLLLVGLLFLGLSVYLARSDGVPSLTVVGTTDRPYPDAQVMISAEVLPTTRMAAGQQLTSTAYPAPKQVRVVVSAPGFLRDEKLVDMPHGDVVLDLRTVKLQRADFDYALPPQGSATLPKPDASLPPPGQATFGKGSQP